MRLNGKRAVIIGAAGEGNLGQVVARQFAAEGATVMVAGRHEEPLAAIAGEIGGHHALADICDEAQLAALGQAAVDKMGGVDIAVNATGWGLLTPFLDTTRAELERITALQFIGPYQFFQAMLRVMNDGGSIVQVSSATAKIMMEDHAAYMGTKAGIDHVVRCIANEFGARGIRANSVAPGFTASPMTERAARNPAVVGAFAKEYPLGRVGTLEDTAEAITWLCTDGCFITGEVLQVNGGVTLRRNPTNSEIVAAAKAAKAAREG
ncbi:SDR family NAD(P)-dependent oxidoreductase [uncultured Maritimibacter sp.]|jgi:NAD(P)-dependent dehydrogenase (short-subunit alcohol dehydrogenase family)|uniref:SDR family NAD(P)-dependent oxidoreductase n=1 Tax=uncultured Maritimibacter sp. TaxID=991866 RepID=UPI002633C80D|nr:SDR family oxidoreductase [uncultured Maritimibacter sp.]